MSPLARLNDANWKLVPHHLHGQLERWVTDGVAPKSEFLHGLLRGDLKNSLAAASFNERRRFFDLVDFLNHHCPHECWGSAAEYRQWAKLNGRRGMIAETEKAGGIYDS